MKEAGDLSRSMSGSTPSFNGRNSKGVRERLPRSPRNVAAGKLDALDQAEIMDDLRVPPGNRLEAMRGDRRGQHSIRSNDQHRICFRWTDSGPVDVEIVDYH